MSEADPQGVPTTLRIRFAAGERPYVFWLSPWVEDEGEPVRFKVLSKQLATGALEFLVLREAASTRRKSIAYLSLPADFPSGWLERWVASFESDLGCRFQQFDLRDIRTRAEWQEVALRLGWSLGE